MLMQRSRILSWATAGESRAVYAANVHVIMEAHDDIEFRNILNRADLVAPDGMPLVWMMRLKGVKSQQRTYGPTLMLEILEMAARQKIPVGFYGGLPTTLEMLVKRMKTMHHGLQVGYVFSPPFRTLSWRRIHANSTGYYFFWCANSICRIGLPTPGMLD